MNRRHVLSVIILIQVFFHCGRAQTPDLKFHRIDGPNGKPFGRIRNITQDSDGYMWFSDEGEKCIYRYDGKSLKLFNHEDNKNSLAAGIVNAVYGDPYGPIWISVGNGLDRYDPATGIFTHYVPDPTNESSIADGASEVIRDKKGRLWVGTYKSVDLLDEKTGTFKHFGNDETNPYSIYHVGVWNLYEDRQGTIWAACGIPWVHPNPKTGGLYRINEDGTVTRFAHDPEDPGSLINNKVRAMFEDSRGVFWVGTGGDGLHIMDRKTGTFTRLRYDPNHPEKLSRPFITDENENKFRHDSEQITFILEDTVKTIWIGSMWSGINRYDPQTNKVTYYHEISGFSDSTSWNAFKSKDGVIWLTTNKDANVVAVNPYFKETKTISTSGEVSKFYEEEDGTLWVSTHDEGLYKYDKNFNLLKHFKHKNDDPLSLQDIFNTVVNISPIGDTLWLGTRSGLEIFNKRNETFSRLHTSDGRDTLLTNKPAVQVVKDDSETYWITSWGNGLLRYNVKDNSLSQFLPQSEDPKSVNHETLFGLVKDNQGNLWISGFGGLSRLIRQTNSFENYFNGFGAGLTYQDSKGIVWVAALDDLYYFDNNTNQFKNFLASEAPSKIEVSSIAEDNNHILWLNAKTFLIRANPSSKEMYFLGKEFGINNLTRPIYKLRDGRILSGHASGFYYFNPEDYYIKPRKPKILISNFMVNGSEVLGKEILSSKTIDNVGEIQLKYNQNNLFFSIATDDYASPENTRYRVLMENQDTVWREMKDNLRLDYFNLSEGSYDFKMKAYLGDGRQTERTLVIIVFPPWWQTWWAYTSYIGFFILSVWGVSKYRARALQSQNKILEEKVTIRTAALNNSLDSLKVTQKQLIQSEKMASLGELTAGIAHEIQNPLNFVNNFSEVNKELLLEMKEEIDKGNLDNVKTLADDVIENQEKINHHGKRADAIVKGMMQHSRSSSGIKEPTDINDLADEYLRLAYHGLRAKDKSFNSSMNTDFDPSVRTINIIPQDIGRVILNLITNAFYAVSEKKKQLPEGYDPTVSVSTKRVRDKVLIAVKDNGNGIPQKVLDKIFQPFFTSKPSGQGTGLGLSLSYDIVKAHGGEIKVETIENEGAEFTIVLPV